MWLAPSKLKIKEYRILPQFQQLPEAFQDTNFRFQLKQIFLLIIIWMPEKIDLITAVFFLKKKTTVAAAKPVSSGKKCKLE